MAAVAFSIAQGERWLREAAEFEGRGRADSAAAKYRLALKHLHNHAQYAKMIHDKLRQLERGASCSAPPSSAEDSTVSVVSTTPLPQVTWDDVAGLHEVKALIRRHVDLPKKHPHLRTHKQALSMLLYGPPGTGLSLGIYPSVYSISSSMLTLSFSFFD